MKASMKTPSKKALVLAAGSLFFCSAVLAESLAVPDNITSVHPQEMKQLVVLHRRADELILKNDLRGALQVYLDILLIEPDDASAYTGMGQTYLILGEYGKAKEAFQNALHIEPDNDTAAYGLQKIMDPDGVAGMV